jgi:hypothetical protein
MDALVKPLEALLAPIFKSLPSLPEGVKNTIIKIWPWAALALGILQMFAVLGLWQMGHVANAWVNYANELSAVTGQPTTYSLGIFYWLGLAMLALDGLLLLCAFAPLRAGKKSGWNLLFLSAIINLVYGIVIVFDGYYGAWSNLFGSLIGSAIAFYFLYQVRDHYVSK